jgi:hypothetical protein
VEGDGRLGGGGHQHDGQCGDEYCEESAHTSIS